jgi:hypothetical protein
MMSIPWPNKPVDMTDEYTRDVGLVRHPVRLERSLLAFNYAKAIIQRSNSDCGQVVFWNKG